MQFQGFDWLSGHGHGHIPWSRKSNHTIVLAKQNQQDIAIFLDCF